jgi:restriction endonuclease S subunit
MKQGWDIKKLKDVTSLITDGDWIESRHQSEDGIRLIQTGNVGNGFFKAKDDKPHFISEETFDVLGCTEIFEGDCLVSRLPDPVGRACLIPKMDCRMITAVDCSIIRFNKVLIPDFFVYYSQSSKYQNEISNKTTGTTRKRISRKNLELVPIPVPPITEQAKIVEELDCLSGIIENKKQQLKELDALAQSIFYEMFGDPVENDKRWEVKRIEDICDVCRGGSPRPIDKFLGGNIPWIKIGDATQGDSIFLTQTKEHIIEEGLRKTRFIHSGSLIFANCGVSLGFARIITFDGCIHDGWLAFDNVSEEIDKIFFLKSLNFCTPYFRSIAPDGVQPNLNTSIMKAFKQILPPLSMQKDYVDKIQAIEKQKLLITESLVQAEMLLNSRMDYYFN